jgi:hypothetical protein
MLYYLNEFTHGSPDITAPENKLIKSAIKM